MKVFKNGAKFADWLCGKCGSPLELGKVNVGYLRSRFTVELPKCPKCGLVLIPEDLATGRMANAEKALEDK
jgi:ribosomal protein S27AE